MQDKLNKNTLVDLVSERAKVSIKDAKNVIDETFNLIQESLINGEEVNIKNFGVFVPKVRSTRTGTHPSNHKIIKIPSKKTVFLRLSENFKDKLN